MNGEEWKATRVRVLAEHAARLSAASLPPQEAEGNLVARKADFAEPTAGARSVDLNGSSASWVRAPDNTAG
jgi:hypothetical protein